MSADENHVADLIAKRQAAENAVEGMDEGARKDKAFEMVFQRLLDGHGQPTGPRRRTRAKQVGAPKSGLPTAAATPPSGRASPREPLSRLVEDGFFDGQRSLPDIAQELENRGHIYKQTTLSPHMIRMTREKALRRYKDKREGGREMWFYERVD